MMDFFGGGGESVPDNSGVFQQFSDRMRKDAQSYNPWIETGNKSRDMSFDQYQQLINNPNFVQDKVASGFQESPYQKYIQDLTQKRMNYNAANTGFQGSGAANRAMADELSKMTGGFLDTYINRGMGSYGQGLSGLDALTKLGFNGLTNQNDMYEQAAAGELQGGLSKNAHQAYEDAHSNDWIGNLVGTGLGMFAGGTVGGPQGAMMGGKMGRQMMGAGGGQQGGQQSGMPTAQLGLNAVYDPVPGGGYRQSYQQPSNSIFNIGGFT